MCNDDDSCNEEDDAEDNDVNATDVHDDIHIYNRSVSVCASQNH